MLRGNIQRDVSKRNLCRRYGGLCPVTPNVTAAFSRGRREPLGPDTLSPISGGLALGLDRLDPESIHPRMEGWVPRNKKPLFLNVADHHVTYCRGMCLLRGWREPERDMVTIPRVLRATLFIRWALPPRPGQGAAAEPPREPGSVSTSWTRVLMLLSM